ncbi:MAG: hypothetical protein ACFFCS_04440 [Candidatus Hodarchaeota archaeon]
MTKITEIVKIDDRGRIVIPGSARKVMSLVPNTKLLMTVDENEITLVPFLGTDSDPIRIRIKFSDERGSLAKIATKISELGINLLVGEAHFIRKGLFAEWNLIADLSTMDEPKTLEEISEKIKENGALEVEFQKF